MMKNLFKGTVERRQVEKLRKAVNKFIEKNGLEICTLTREDMYDVPSLKITNDIIIDYVLSLSEDDAWESEGAGLHNKLRNHIMFVTNGIVRAPKYNHLFKVKTAIAIFCILSALFCTGAMIVYGFEVIAFIDIILSVPLAICAGIGAKEELGCRS